MYKTKITTQGTISIPKALRHKYDLRPGDTLSVQDTGVILITKQPDFATLRTKNASFVQNTRPYQSGDGWTAHITETYGS